MEATFQTSTRSFVITERRRRGAAFILCSHSPSNRGQCHHISYYLLVLVVLVRRGRRGGGTYILKCSVDCLRHAPDVVVAVFLRILCKEQLANFSDCRLYFHNSSRRAAATRRPLRLQRRNVTVRSQNTTKFQIAP